MNTPSQFGRVAATCIALLAPPAFAWPTVDDPPRSTTEWIAPEIRVNGLPSRILSFESELTPQEILAFYRERWKHLTGGKGTRESTAGDWQVIAALQNTHQIVVQVRPRAPQGSDGVISMADFGAAKPARLDVIAKLCGMPGKVGIEGKDVGPLVHAGRIDEVRKYCLCDVVQTAGVFMRLQLVRGELPQDSYLAAMRGLITFIRGEERLGVVAAGLNEKRLMLEEATEAS